ncbi:MAG: MerR family transcriptional regulator [Eubacteriales bacterium]|jgi:DNA-binding transcriptional MerR regulator|nr:MerR family transcriptional regulator [Eubacteriales bacterium]MDD3082808.1 MerR family transcriptional regulator [Desulfobacterales bacterium]MDD3864244.1 MerR family transcriptional regulator [Eubacteriales bacterium]MDD4445603.1 MerR family transcriptional regulator [Eubacteriales bacterium]
MKSYRTAQVAKIVGVHPNTVRLYEQLGLIPPPERQRNGYRVFTDLHIAHFKLARMAFAVEVLQNGLRKKAVNIVKIAASGNYDQAIAMAEDYLRQIRDEQRHAQEAIEITKEIFGRGDVAAFGESGGLTRKETAEELQVTIDTLRNWEMNGLLTVKRRLNGYRIYNAEDIRLLKIIRSLRCANYSLSAILRMLQALSGDPEADLSKVIDTPDKDEDIVSACDRLLTSLRSAEINASAVLEQLSALKNI